MHELHGTPAATVQCLWDQLPGNEEILHYHSRSLFIVTYTMNIMMSWIGLD